MRHVQGSATAGALVLALAFAPVGAQQNPFADYQRMTADGSPVELFELSGEELWKKKQGPKSTSLEQCDLGKGPGVLKGAYAALPRYFKDVDRVMDLEARLLQCMLTLQGPSREEATKRVLGNADQPSEMEYLSAYIAGQSRGAKMAPGSTHPKEKEAHALGKALFFHRAGAWDFSCASCHGEPDLRIRMSDLPVLSEPKFASDSMIALNLYLATTAKGAEYRGPGTKR